MRCIGTTNITSTQRPNNVIEVQFVPESNDVIGLRDIFLKLDISNSQINMLKDVISSVKKYRELYLRKISTSLLFKWKINQSNMIQTGFESRVKIQDIILSQLPEFISDDLKLLIF